MVVIVVVLVAVWALVVVKWWRVRAGRAPLFARSDGQPRWAASTASTVVGITGVSVGALNLAFAATADETMWWSYVGAGAFLLMGVSGFVDGRRQRAREVASEPTAS